MDGVNVIQKLKNGKFRVRYDFGYNSYYRSLLKQLKNLKNKKNDSKFKEILDKVTYLEVTIGNGKTVNIKTRRSFNCRNLWQAEHVEKVFKDAYDIESSGGVLPDYLIKELDSFTDAPYKLDYLEELSYKLASYSDFNPNVIKNIEYDVFLEQASVDVKWMDNYNIKEKEVKDFAIKISCDQ